MVCIASPKDKDQKDKQRPPKHSTEKKCSK